MIEKQMRNSMKQEFQPFFICCCGKALPECGDLPDWADWRAFSCTGWSAGTEAVTNEFFKRIDCLPEPGSVQCLHVDEHFGIPKLGETVWVLFTPWNSSINGWDSNPEEIPLSGLVRIELIDIVSKVERHASLSVRVLEILRLTELHLYPPRELIPSPLPRLMCDGKIYCDFFRDFAYSTSSEDDGNKWTLCQRHHGRWNLLLHSEWCYHSEDIHVGNRPLTIEEAASLGLPDSHGSDAN